MLSVLTRVVSVEFGDVLAWLVSECMDDDQYGDPMACNVNWTIVISDATNIAMN